MTAYAVDIQEDNVLEARKRLHSVVMKFISSQKEEKARKSSIHFLGNLDFILERTILVGNTLDDNDKKKKLKCVSRTLCGKRVRTVP